MELNTQEFKESEAGVLGIPTPQPWARVCLDEMHDQKYVQTSAVTSLIREFEGTSIRIKISWKYGYTFTGLSHLCIFNFVLLSD